MICIFPLDSNIFLQKSKPLSNKKVLIKGKTFLFFRKFLRNMPENSCLSDYFTAIASISQSTPFGRSLTATQLLAGFEVKYFA